MKNLLRNIPTDLIFDIFFQGEFEKPSEHKKECVSMLINATYERLDSINNNLKAIKELEIC